jgi:2-(1,2-epoxy-1,2-dihydrophenyl)acetyl-CoA isomerase
VTVTSYEEAVALARAEKRQLVDVIREGARAEVHLNDAEKLNPLSAALTVQLHDALAELCRDSGVRTILLTGADPAFCAGGDLRLMRDVAHPIVDEGSESAAGVWEWVRQQFGGIARLIVRSDKAFVAAVNGAAAGVGLSFALSCDIIVASERAQLVPAFGRIGLLPEVGQSWLLTRRLGYQRTFELFASGRHLSGREAFDLGLVNDVVPHEELLGRARRSCEEIEAMPLHVQKMIKPLLRGAADMTWEQAIATEEFAEPICFTTEAHRAGVAALLQEDEKPPHE